MRLAIRHIIVFIFNLVCVLTAELSAQQMELNTKPVYFEELGVHEGLSAGFIGTVTQDDFGYLWIGTSVGLNRYDGYSVKSYFHSAIDTLGLPGGTIYALFSDVNNNLWLKDSEVYKLMSLPELRGQDIELSDFSHFQQDPNDNIWGFKPEDEGWFILPKDTLLKYNNPLKDKLSYNHFIKAEEWMPTFPWKDITKRIFFFDSKVLWIKDNRLFCVKKAADGSQFKIQYSVDLKSHVPKEEIFDHILVDENKELLFVYTKHHLLSIDLESGALVYQLAWPTGLVPRGTNFLDSKGYLWMKFADGNNYLFDTNSRTFSLLTMPDFGNVNPSEIYYDIRRFFEDSNGNIWMPTNGAGLLKYSHIPNRFKYYGRWHKGPALGRIYRSVEGHLIFQRSNSLDSFNFKKNKIDSFLDSSAISGYQNSWAVWANFQDDRGVFHFSIKDKNSKLGHHYRYTLGNRPLKATLSKLDPTYGSIYLYHEGDLEWRMRIQRGVADNASQNNLVVFSYDSEQNRVGKSFEYNCRSTIGEFSDHLRGKDSSLWLSFYGSGLFRLNFDNGNWQHYSKHASSTSKLDSDNIFCLAQDSSRYENILWIGTNRGMLRLDYKNGQIKSYNRNSGWPDNVVYGILPDAHDNLWASTNNGLVFFNPESEKHFVYTKNDGIQHNEFNKGSFAKINDTLLCFGGMGGLSYFNPEDFYGATTASKVIINGLRINNKEVLLNESDIKAFKGLKLDLPLEKAEDIYLDYDKRVLSFEFALMDFINPAGNEFRYRLTPQINEWIDLGKQNELTITNLDPGTYRLEVLGLNYEGEWSKDPRIIHIHIKPPWYMSLWFSLLVSGLIISGIVAFFRYRQQQLKRIIKMREKISSDLHDEIGSTLSSISLFSLAAQKDSSFISDKVENILNRINENSVQAIQAMNDIVWAINTSNDSLKDLVFRMRAFASDIMDSSEWVIHFDYDEILEKEELGMMQRHNVYMIFKEAINNSIKYSSGENFLVRIRKKNKVFLFEFIDDGVGFDPNMTNSPSMGGNGLINMERRAREMNAGFKLITDARGTRILLELPA